MEDFENHCQYCLCLILISSVFFILDYYYKSYTERLNPYLVLIYPESLSYLALAYNSLCVFSLTLIIIATIRLNHHQAIFTGHKINQ